MTLRHIIKTSAYGTAAAVGAATRLGRHRGDGLIALTYHSVGDGREHPYLNRMPPERFRQQLRYLKSHYDVVDVREGLNALASSNRAPRQRPMVAITVDDGYVDNHDLIFPIAREEGVSVAFFVATDYIDNARLPWPTRIAAMVHFATRDTCPLLDQSSQPTTLLPTKSQMDKHAACRALMHVAARLDRDQREQWLDELQQSLAPTNMNLLAPMQWAHIRQMTESGMLIGSHTHMHGWLDCVSPDELQRELAEGKSRIEHETGTICDVIAYPNGNHGLPVRQATKQAGYRYGLTQDRGINRPAGDDYAVLRVEIPFDEPIGTFACRVGGLTV
jgi:peptidoglycan/xylan/chitin deacetylase (PgdA/CDA1 family)